MKLSIIKFLIVLIFILGIILRFFRLTSYPSGFHIDEATLGYNSYSILLTGRDENNSFLPLYSQSFGLDRALGNFLVTAASIATFGLNEFAIRAPFAFFGILTIPLFYLFAKEISTNRYFSLIATFLLTISPWHIDMVRASSETSVSLFFILFGQLLFIKGIKHKNLWLLFISVISFFVSIWFYHAAIGFLIMTVPFIGFFFIKKEANIRVRKMLIVTLVASLLLFFSFLVFGKGGIDRFSQVGFHRDQSVLNEQNKMFFEEGPNHIFQARFFHNKLITYSRAAVKNYSQYLNLDFLFLNAGKPPRYSPPAMGLIYVFELPFLLYGIYKAIIGKSVFFKMVLGLLLLSPLVAALTYEYSPNMQRSFFMVPYLEIMITLGIFSSLSLLTRHRLVIYSSVIIFSLSMLYYLHQYYIHFPVHDPLYRNDGAKELVKAVTSYKNSYSKIYVTNDLESPYHYFLFSTDLIQNHF